MSGVEPDELIVMFIALQMITKKLCHKGGDTFPFPDNQLNASMCQQ